MEREDRVTEKGRTAGREWQKKKGNRGGRSITGSISEGEGERERMREAFHNMRGRQ